MYMRVKTGGPKPSDLLLGCALDAEHKSGSEVVRQQHINKRRPL